MRAWAALRPASVESRFEALHASGLTELVGREEELELLLRRWSKAKTGEGQVVLLSGEAGIGKSRLTAALLERLAASRTRACATSVHRSTPTARSIRSSARWNVLRDLRTTTPRKRKLDKLDAVLALTSTSKQDAALFAEMLSLPNDGRYPALELTPQQRRQKTLEALTRASGGVVARQQPVLMIFEDAHWTDPTSLEAFGRAVDRIRTLPRAADRHLPAGVRAAVDRTAARNCPHHQSAGEARNRRNDRPRRRQQVASGEVSGRTSSSAPTASPCSSRK